MTFFEGFRRLFGGSDAQTSDFSDFFRKAPPAEKKKRILEAVRKANEDQRQMVEKYRKLKTTR